MDVMIDLETFDNVSTTAIVQIGAAVFDRTNGKIIDEFKADVDPQSCIDIGLTLGIDTIMWWLKQSDEARASITSTPRGPIREVLTNFNNFITKNEPDIRKVTVWCHATFDFPIMQNVYKAAGMEAPWRYSNARDLRTITDLSGAPIYAIRRKGTYHDALDDCRHQVKQFRMCMKKLNL
jgi:inhibitor of KinA sporulation pathway (predicted exonuclease)